MYFSTVELNSHVWNERDKLELLRAQDAYHGFIWSLFDQDPETARDFIYRVESDTTPPRFVVLSKRKPNPSEGVLVRSREFSPQLQVGDELLFETRVNPVVQRSMGRGNNSVKHDVVMDAKFHANNPEYLELTEYERVRKALLEWFHKRGEIHGFQLEDQSFTVENYRQHRLPRGPRRKPLRFSSVDCRGKLIVQSPEHVTRLALHGLGSAKAFGCGLILLRRA